MTAQGDSAANERLVAVMGGGDWADASVDHLVVPTDLDIETARARHREWYQKVYLGQRKRGGTAKYLSFPEWLVEREGARRATNFDIVEVWDGP